MFTIKSCVSLRNCFILMICVVFATIVFYNAGFNYEDSGFWKILMSVRNTSIEENIISIDTTKPMIITVRPANIEEKNRNIISTHTAKKSMISTFKPANIEERSINIITSTKKTMSTLKPANSEERSKNIISTASTTKPMIISVKKASTEERNIMSTTKKTMIISVRPAIRTTERSRNKISTSSTKSSTNNDGEIKLEIPAEWTSPTIQDTQEQCASATSGKATPLPSTMGCQIPFMDPFHPQIMKYISSTADPQCSGSRYGELVDGVLHFKDARVKSATYQAISRLGETRFSMSGSKPVVPGQKIADGLIEVDFVLDNNQHAKELFLHTVPREDLLKREAQTKPGIPLNILVIGLDSVSHGSAQRRLPNIYKFLRDELGAYFFHGHSVTGDGTIEQMAPMLTGRKFMEELYEARPDRSKSTTVDGWPWIYKQLKECGYITGYNEDGTHLGPFNWRLKGFSSPPTDYYPIPFFRKTKSMMKGVDQCVGAKNVNQYQYDFVRSFFKVYSNKLKFFLSFAAGYSHHELNRVQKLQRDLLVLLKDLHSANVFDNTLLIVMGDHGVRWGSVRETIQGKLEERMPFFSMAFPSWFATKFPKIAESLRTNENRLTTWYDVYATLRHMLSYPDLPNDIKHGQSLFTDVPTSRTCKDAFVPSFWCPCLRWSAVDTKHRHAQNVALAAIEWMNSLISKNNKVASQCQTLTLNKVTSAVLERPNDLVLRFRHVDLSYIPRYRPSNNPTQIYFCRYQVQFVTAPNDATYVVEAKFYKKKFIINTDITRIDNLGSQAQCTVSQLRKYCACKT